MKRMFLVIVVLGCLILTACGTKSSSDQGQELRQWASSAAASSEFSNPSWAAVQAVGQPDTRECGDQTTAWASSSSAGNDWLEVRFATPVIPSQINIYESYEPNQVVQVELIGSDGTYFVVYTGLVTIQNTCPFIFTIDVDIDTPVVGALITIDQTNSDLSWNEIDAVELVGIIP
jgi:hypothetical protein